MNHAFYELDAEEQDLLNSFESGEWVSAPNQKEEIEKLRMAAKLTNSKTKNINIRLSERDLYRLKAMAVREGIPYQTLVASIIHKNI